MKHYLVLLTFGLTFHSLASAASCDLKQLEDEWGAAWDKQVLEMEAKMAKDESAFVDMSAYIKAADALRACQKIADPKNLSPCKGFSIWKKKTISASFSLERFFEIFQNRKGTCSQDLPVQYILRNAKGEQLLYAQGGSIVMTNVIESKAVGIPTGRTYLFKDGAVSGDSQVFVIDFPEPMDKFDISLFWGLNLKVGNGTEKLVRSLQGSNLTFQWSNGAFVTIDSVSQNIIDSNFLAPNSYKPGFCSTDNDKSPKGKTRYFPRLEFLTGAEKLVSEPTMVQ